MSHHSLVLNCDGAVVTGSTVRGLGVRLAIKMVSFFAVLLVMDRLDLMFWELNSGDVGRVVHGFMERLLEFSYGF